MENLPQIGKNLSNAQKEAQPSKFIIYTIKAIAVIFTAILILLIYYYISMGYGFISIWSKFIALLGSVSLFRMRKLGLGIAVLWLVDELYFFTWNFITAEMYQTMFMRYEVMTFVIGQAVLVGVLIISIIFLFTQRKFLKGWGI